MASMLMILLVLDVTSVDSHPPSAGELIVFEGKHFKLEIKSDDCWRERE
jgi:hypothetical protein